MTFGLSSDWALTRGCNSVGGAAFLCGKGQRGSDESTNDGNEVKRKWRLRFRYKPLN